MFKIGDKVMDLSTEKLGIGIVVARDDNFDSRNEISKKEIAVNWYDYSTKFKEHYSTSFPYNWWHQDQLRLATPLEELL